MHCTFHRQQPSRYDSHPNPRHTSQPNNLHIADEGFLSHANNPIISLFSIPESNIYSRKIYKYQCTLLTLTSRENVKGTKRATYPPQPSNPFIQPRRKNAIHITKHLPRRRRLSSSSSSPSRRSRTRSGQLLRQERHHRLKAIRAADFEDPLAELGCRAHWLKANSHWR